jgi:FKBP-type peptidyl-prolyl cis-trans isomerase FkpA
MRIRLLPFALLLGAVAACSPTEPPRPSYPAEQTYAASLGVDLPTFVKVDTNLYYKDLVVGTGATATSASKITVTYAGYLVNGTSFDSGTLTDQQLTGGAISFIAGWQLGIPGMKVGGKRKLVIGSNYGYASQAQPGIPARSTLVFDIDLKAVK